MVHVYVAKSSRNKLHLPLEDGGGVNAVASDGVGVLFRSILDGVISQNNRGGGRQLVRHTKRSARHKYFLGDGFSCFPNTHWTRSCEDWDSTGFATVLLLARISTALCRLDSKARACGFKYISSRNSLFDIRAFPRLLLILIFH